MDEKRNENIEIYYARMRSIVAQKYKSLDVASHEVMFHLIHSFNLVEGLFVDHLSMSELTPSGFNVLTLLSHEHENGLSLSRISELLLVSRANVTGLIDSLEKKGLVKRVDHKTDRRIYMAFITKKGEKVLHEYRPIHYQMIGTMCSQLSVKGKHSIIELLKKLEHGIAECKNLRGAKSQVKV